MALPAGMSSCAMCVQLWTSTTWTDVSDNMTVVEAPSATRMTGEAYVFGEDIAVTAVGKREPVEVRVRGIWVEGTTDPFYNIYTNFMAACGTATAVRWAPGGCTTAHDVFATSTATSEVVELVFPGGDAGSADILAYEFVIRAAEVTRAVWS